MTDCQPSSPHRSRPGAHHAVLALDRTSFHRSRAADAEHVAAGSLSKASIAGAGQNYDPICPSKETLQERLRVGPGQPTRPFRRDSPTAAPASDRLASPILPTSMWQFARPFLCVNVGRMSRHWTVGSER